jgi:hypothetical protein
VFVLATHDDPEQRHYLNLYKLGEGPLYSFYTPYHLCHFEVPASVARAVLFGDAVMTPLAGPVVDVVTTAKVDLAAGVEIDAMGGYLTYGQAENADVTRAERLLPMGLAEGCRLRRAWPRTRCSPMTTWTCRRGACPTGCGPSRTPTSAERHSQPRWRKLTNRHTDETTIRARANG